VTLPRVILTPRRDPVYDRSKPGLQLLKSSTVYGGKESIVRALCHLKCHIKNGQYGLRVLYLLSSVKSTTEIVSEPTLF
jgi:hypothetical protein